MFGTTQSSHENRQNNALIDSFGRKINYLRLSVTDRCDFRCVYCMAEDMTFLPRAQLCTLEELVHISQSFVALGIRKIRITGGEPLIRKNIQSLFQALGEIEDLEELAITTNGAHLIEHAQSLQAAGVKRINVSLDSLDSAQFTQLTRTGNLDNVLSGINHVNKLGFAKIKLNAVVLKNRNVDQVIPLVRFAIDNGLDLSFIEEMPLGNISEHNRSEEFISSEALRELIQSQLSLLPSSESTGGPSRYWQVPHSNTKIGFISPHSENFCDACNRVRVSAEGKLLLCLGNEHSVDLKQIIRANPGQPEQVQQAIIKAMAIKPERHYFDNDDVQIVRFMNTTGG